MKDHKDVQGKELAGSFILTRVGITGVKRPVTIKRPKKAVTMVPTFDISVDLPAEQKGSHMSRHVEVINRAIDMALTLDSDSVEGLVERIAMELLRSHDYATYADVRLEADYFLQKMSPDDKQVTENYKLISEAKARKGDKRAHRVVGVEVAGMSACPCAMENVRDLMKEDLKARGFSKEKISLLDEIPVPTHNQKNRVRLEVGWDRELPLEADDLIALVESNLSSPTFEILKRKGEATVVLNAHRNPKFVEDIARDVIDSFLDTYRKLPDDVTLYVRSTSEESIHKHDAFAERRATLGELRKKTRYEV